MSPDPICGSGYKTKIIACIVKANSTKCTTLVTITVLKVIWNGKGKSKPSQMFVLAVTHIEKIDTL